MENDKIAKLYLVENNDFSFLTTSQEMANQLINKYSKDFLIPKNEFSISLIPFGASIHDANAIVKFNANKINNKGNENV